MSLIEKAFQKIWSRHAGPPLDDSELEALRRRMNIIAAIFLGHQVEIKFTLEDCGFAGDTLALPKPKSIEVLRQADLFLHLTLLCCESKRRGLTAQEINDRLGFARSRDEIETSLSHQWPGFLEIKHHAHGWAEKNLDRKTKFPARLSDWTLYTSPGLPIAGSPLIFQTNASSTPKNAAKTERKHTGSSQAKVISLDQQQSNPVQHSFEKTETADEYRGGRKMDSGSDELHLHMEALREVNLTTVTRDGESAESVLNVDGCATEMASGPDAARADTNDHVFHYPEWNDRRGVYLRSHCTLLESTEPAENISQHFADRLKKLYQSRLEIWRAQMASLVFEPLWRHRLRDGSEIDIDALIRSFADLKSRAPLNPNLYSNKINRDRDLDIVILFDQSQSSDAWVDDRRVLDVTMESIGLLGLLLEDVLPKVEIAGTWSATRHKCHYHTYKAFEESWALFYRSASGVNAQGYTRIGPAIRHAISRLKKSPARKKSLLIFTDGKPTDLDGYEGRHGMKDVRQACLEAEACNVLPMAFLVGNTGSQTEQMFTHVRRISHPYQLPDQVFQTLAHLL